MNPQQYQYYSFFENNRRKALLKYAQNQAYVTMLRHAVAAGIDPRKDGDLSKYWVLIDEESREILISEINTMLCTEQEGFTH